MQKKIPMRQCLGCREMKAKRELIRVVRSPEGEVSLDFKGKANGRGAYICPNAECLKRAVKAKALERAFSVQIPAEVYEKLNEEMEAGA
jgi:predicted RNA-binding protein YlxR (DUF448 family)